MKILLAGFMCGLLTTLQCFAIDGGPVYPGGSGVVTTGTYAGVMLPDMIQSPGSNSIALFSVTIPRSGLGTGPFVVFNLGETYVGTIQGTADPDSGKLFGLVNGTFPVVEVVPDPDGSGSTSITFSAVASGQVKGFVRSNPNAFSTSAARITGTADVQFSLTVNNVDDEIIYQVFGFKQQDV
jgi:hypothetical protein